MVSYVGETSHAFSEQGISPFLLATERIQEGTKNSDQSERLLSRQQAWKQSESLVLQVVPDEQFLHTKINNKDVYVDYVYDYVVLQKISQKMHAVSGDSIMDGDLTALN